MVIYFDDDCLLCNKAVQFISKKLKSDELYFAPIGGVTYQNLILAHPELTEIDSIIVESNKKVFTKSKAIYLIVKQLQWPYQFLLLMGFLPNSFLDKMYDFIAKYRPKKKANFPICHIDRNIQVLP